MTTIAQTRARTVASLAESVVAFVRTLADARAKRAAYRATVTELRALGDRELDDLGISRWDIELVARRSVYGV